MNSIQKLSAASAVVLLGAFWSPGHAALVTVTGSQFDLTYDTTKLGLFGAPTLTGNTLSFTFNNFSAQSLNGAGAVNTNSTISGLEFTAKSGFQFGAFDLVEFGDYTISGNGSFVRVLGQLRAFDVTQSLTTQTTANLVVSAFTPLNINDGLNHDWSARARIDASTPTVPSDPLDPSVPPSLFNAITAGSGRVGMTIENRLTAYTDPASNGFREAFIEKKFVGVGLQVTVSPAPVPLPPTAALTLVGLTGLVLVARRKRRAAGSGTA